MIKLAQLLTAFSLVLLGSVTMVLAQKNQASDMPAILVNSKVKKANYLPDFSFAGYHFGEKDTPTSFDHTLSVTDFGAKPDDGFDDSSAFIEAVKKADELQGTVVIQIPAGKFNISKIIYINRSKTVLRGVGTGERGTVLYFSRGLEFVKDPPQHEELLEYLEYFDKRNVDVKQGVDNIFSQYSWSGAFIWVAKKGKFYKSYNLPKYNQPIISVAKGTNGKQGAFEISVDDVSKLVEGKTYRLLWFNEDGKEGSLLKHMYDDKDVTIGEHHWDNPSSPLMTQIIQISKVLKRSVIIKDPLLYHIKKEWNCSIAEWSHIEEVGIENIAFEFPKYPDVPHHLEHGNNAIYLTSLMNGWVKNVRINNGDSGVLTDDISTVTIENVVTSGENLAHYSVSMGEVHNVLVKDLLIKNRVRHPLSFNTRSTKCVYTNCVVEKQPKLDQHSCANAQNLFDDLRLFVNAPVHETLEYALFASGGSKLWQPAHGAFNTMFNIRLKFANTPNNSSIPIVLRGIKNGVSARLIGIHANHLLKTDYSLTPYQEFENQVPAIPSLYKYQLQKRLNSRR